MFSAGIEMEHWFNPIKPGLFRVRVGLVGVMFAPGPYLWIGTF